VVRLSKNVVKLSEKRGETFVFRLTDNLRQSSDKKRHLTDNLRQLSDKKRQLAYQKIF
jgi:hypothetical protein